MHACCKKAAIPEKKTFLKAFPRKCIPSKYTRYMVLLYMYIVQTCSFGIHLQIDLWNPQFWFAFLQINLADYALSNRYLPSRSIFIFETNAIPCVCTFFWIIIQHIIIIIHLVSLALGMSPPSTLLSRIPMPQVSPQETVSETTPSPKSHPQGRMSETPPYPESRPVEGYPCHHKTIDRSRPLQNRPPVPPSLTKSPSCLLLDRRERTDHPPHQWGPCIKDTTQYQCVNRRISTRLIVDYLQELYNCGKHVIVYGYTFWEI